MRMLMRPSDATCWVGIAAYPHEIVIGVGETPHGAIALSLQDVVDLVVAVADRQARFVGFPGNGLDVVPNDDEGGFGVGFSRDGDLCWSYVAPHAVDVVTSALLDAVAVADTPDLPVWSEMDRLAARLVMEAQRIGVSPYYPLTLVASGMNNIPVVTDG